MYIVEDETSLTSAAEKKALNYKQLLNKSYCPFCGLEQKKELYEFLNTIPKTMLTYSRRVLWENDEFFIIPDISPITEYHFLIIPKHHYQSIEEIPHSFANFLNEAKRVIETKVGCISEKTIVYFEHGTCIEPEGACVSHAHLHCLPLSNDELTALLIKIRRINDLAEESSGSENYVFIQINDQVYRWIDEFKVKQFLRRLFAQTLKLPARLNWKRTISEKKERDLSMIWINNALQLFNQP